MRNLVWFLGLLSGVAFAATVGPTDRFIPLIQDGGGWSTEIVVMNLSARPERVTVTLSTARASAEAWEMALTVSTGAVVKGEVVADLAPGALLRVQTPGTAAALTRGFAEVVELLSDRPIGAYARLTRRVEGQVVQTFSVPLSPGQERRSVVPLDLSQGANAELIFVSLTNVPILELVFRNARGEKVAEDQLTFGTGAQLFVNAIGQWPNLKDFVGTMEWSVSFPMADRYERRTLSAISLWSREAGVIFPISGMTLPGDQASMDPYEQ